MKRLAVCVLGLLLLAGSPLCAASVDWIWQEGEQFEAQRGSTGEDGKAAASGGMVLGLNWGGSKEDRAGYAVTLRQPIPGARLILRYAKQDGKDSVLELLVDGKPAGDYLDLEGTWQGSPDRDHPAGANSRELWPPAAPAGVQPGRFPPASCSPGYHSHRGAEGETGAEGEDVGHRILMLR